MRRFTVAGSASERTEGKTPHASAAGAPFACSATLERRCPSSSRAMLDGVGASLLARAMYSRWRFLSALALSMTGRTMFCDMYEMFSSNTGVFCPAATFFAISAARAASSFVSTSASVGRVHATIVLACLSTAAARSAGNTFGKSAATRALSPSSNATANSAGRPSRPFTFEASSAKIRSASATNISLHLPSASLREANAAGSAAIAFSRNPAPTPSEARAALQRPSDMVAALSAALRSNSALPALSVAASTMTAMFMASSPRLLRS